MGLAHRCITALSTVGAALIVGCSTDVRSGEDFDTNTVDQGVAPKEEGVAPKEEGVAPKEEGVAPKEEGVAPKEEGVAPKEESLTPEEETCSTELLFDGVTCPDDCTGGVLGDGVTCQDPNALIEQGIPLCEEIGLVLRDLQVDKADYAVCDGKVLQAEYLCCPAWPAWPEEPSTPPPPPEPGCDTTGVVGDGTTCEDPNALKDEALAICTSLGLPLSHFDASIAPCETGTLEATYACCP
ncbi:hypothetical protein AB3662_35555 [Sorangium cellulosum]|uniref:hypothetical protein n=1 Tax=Sorangium cellulosum TaxID=56 RepID=UPI003D9A34B0